MYYYQKHMVFFPTKNLSCDPDSIRLDFETIILNTKDGERLHGWYLPKEGATHAMLFLHGNAGNISGRLSTLQLFQSLGLNILIFDYRGYGQSTGTVSEKGTYLDAEAAWKFLTEQKKFSSKQIIVHGRSLGGGVASWVAEKYAPLGLILESTFTSITNIGKETYPFLPVRLLSNIHYNTLKRLKHITSPVLILHSRSDEVIPFSHAEKLYKSAKEPKFFKEIQYDHGNGFLFSKAYIPSIREFLEQLPELSISVPTH